MKRMVLEGPQNDPEATMEIMDRASVHMSVGAEKQRVIDSIITEGGCSVCVELGAYAGYSAVATARLLPPGGHLYSIEFDSEMASIARSILEHSGLADKVTMLVGTGAAMLPTLKRDHGVDKVDFLFIDHDKSWYVSDLQVCEELLHPGSMVVADNILFPGCPEYIQYMEENSAIYSSELKGGFQNGVGKEDAMMVSRRL